MPAIVVAKRNLADNTKPGSLREPRPDGRHYQCYGAGDKKERGGLVQIALADEAAWAGQLGTWFAVAFG